MQFAVPAMVVGTAMQAGSTLMAAREQSRAAAFEEQQLKIQSEQARTRAAQIEAQRRQELDVQLGTIAALRAGRNVGSDSPTALAIYGGVTEEKERQARIERTNELLKSDLARHGAEFASDRRTMAAVQGLLKTGEAIGSGLFKYSKVA